MKFAVIKEYASKKILLSLTAAILLALITGIAAAVAVSHLLNMNRESRAIRDRQVAVDSTYLSLREAESSQRGYLITRDEAYLDRYETATRKMPASLTHLNQITRGTPEQRQVDAFIPVVRAKLDELAQTVKLGKNGDFDGALKLVNTATGKNLMQEIASIRDSIVSKDLAELNRRRGTSGTLGVVAFDIVLLATLLTAVLAGTILYLYLRSVMAQRGLDRAKDEFVSLASHQLRTPATGIKSVLSMLKAEDFGELNPKQHYFLAKAIDSNEREIAIIEELLNVAKADAGRMVLRPVEMDMCSLVETIVGEQQAAINHKRQRLSIKQPDEAVTLMADKDKLYMAIGNLLDNARKYTPEEGNINIAIRGRKGGVAVEVADSGVGIDEDEQSRIFDRFQRARSSITGTTDGTGLGLYLALRIAELHNGTIEVDSRKGHGSKFIMILPQRKA